MDPIVIGPARGKAILMITSALGFVVGGAWMALMSHGTERVTGIVSVAFFGVCGAVGIRELVDKRPRLTIDDNGVFDRTLQVGVIVWEDIVDAEVVSIAGQPCVAVRLRDPSKYIDRLGKAQRRLVELSKSLGSERLHLAVATLNVDAPTLSLLISREAEARRTPAEQPYRE